VAVAAQKLAERHVLVLVRAALAQLLRVEDDARARHDRLHLDRRVARTSGEGLVVRPEAPRRPAAHKRLDNHRPAAQHVLPIEEARLERRVLQARHLVQRLVDGVEMVEQRRLLLWRRRRRRRRRRLGRVGRRKQVLRQQQPDRGCRGH